MARSDTETLILEALEAAAAESMRRYGHVSWKQLYGHSDLSGMVERLWKERFPDRRNRPTARNMEAVLARLVKEGVIERKPGSHRSDHAYRMAASE